MLTVCVEAQEPQDFNTSDMYRLTYFLALSFPLNLIGFVYTTCIILYIHILNVYLYSSCMLYITISGLSSEPLALARPIS